MNERDAAVARMARDAAQIERLRADNARLREQQAREQAQADECMALLRLGDHLERYGDAIYVTEPVPELPKGRRFHFVITVARSQPDNVERVVAIERFDPLKHDHH
jgi:hypothetical protein